jgi:hypothetical protein
MGDPLNSSQPGDGNPKANALGRIYTSDQPTFVAFVALPPPPPAIIQYAPAAAEGIPAATELAPIVVEATPVVAESLTAKAVAVLAATAPEEAAIPVWGWIAIAATVVVVVGIAAYELSQPNAETKPDGNVQVRKDERPDEKDPCDIQPFGEQECPPGKQRHHIVSDFVLRYGKREDTARRIPGMPSEEEGPTICLEGSAWVQGTEHNELQRALDARIFDAGDASGQAPLREILEIAIEETIKFKPECEEQIRKAVEEAFKNVDKDALVRTTYATQTAPAELPSPEIDPDQSIPF